MNLLATKNTDAGWAALRAERDRRIAATDWTVLPDAPFAPEMRAAWAAYRQQLRDITKVDHIRDVVWPEPPKA